MTVTADPTIHEADCIEQTERLGVGCVLRGMTLEEREVALACPSIHHDTLRQWCGMPRVWPS